MHITHVFYYLIFFLIGMISMQRLTHDITGAVNETFVEAYIVRIFVEQGSFKTQCTGLYIYVSLILTVSTCFTSIKFTKGVPEDAIITVCYGKSEYIIDSDLVTEEIDMLKVCEWNIFQVKRVFFPNDFSSLKKRSQQSDLAIALINDQGSRNALQYGVNGFDIQHKFMESEENCNGIGWGNISSKIKVNMIQNISMRTRSCARLQKQMYNMKCAIQEGGNVCLSEPGAILYCKNDIISGMLVYLDGEFCNSDTPVDAVFVKVYEYHEFISKVISRVYPSTTQNSMVALTFLSYWNSCILLIAIHYIGLNYRL